MRLNRRKNRGSESRRKGDSESPRESLSRRVRETRPKGPSADSPKASEKPKRPKQRSERERKSKPARRRRRERSRRARGDFAKRRRQIERVAKSVAADAFGIAREILRWPARIWMAVAEELGKAILLAWRRVVLPAWRILLRALRTALAFGERTVTPARGLTVVALAATIALGGSQFGNYRAVEVGEPGYVKVEEVAQPPQVQSAMPRSAHGVSVFAIAVASLFVTVFAVWRNWRLARLLFFLGVAVVAISLFVDRPEGLKLGTAGEAYAGAHAVLLGCFWVQLFAGATLAVVGPLLARQLRAERAVSRRRPSSRRGDESKSRRAPRLRPKAST